MSEIYKFEMDCGFKPVNEMNEVLDSMYDAIVYACRWLRRKENDAWNGEVYTVHISRKDKYGNFRYCEVIHKKGDRYYRGTGFDKQVNPATGRNVTKKKDTGMHPFGL